MWGHAWKVPSVVRGSFTIALCVNWEDTALSPPGSQYPKIGSIQRKGALVRLSRGALKDTIRGLSTRSAGGTR